MTSEERAMALKLAVDSTQRGTANNIGPLSGQDLYKLETDNILARADSFYQFLTKES
jgi:hypothetical protein